MDSTNATKINRKFGKARDLQFPSTDRKSGSGRAVGAALAPRRQPHLVIIARGTGLFNEINTHSTIPLIWTALAENAPGRESWAPHTANKC